MLLRRNGRFVVVLDFYADFLVWVRLRRLAVLVGFGCDERLDLLASGHPAPKGGKDETGDNCKASGLGHGTSFVEWSVRTTSCTCCASIISGCGWTSAVIVGVFGFTMDSTLRPSVPNNFRTSFESRASLTGYALSCAVAADEMRSFNRSPSRAPHVFAKSEARRAVTYAVSFQRSVTAVR